MKGILAASQAGLSGVGNQKFLKKSLNITSADLGTINNPATSALEILASNTSSQNGFYYIKFSEQSPTQQLYCDMTGGGYMLVAQRINSGSTTLDIRKTGFFTEYPVDNTYYINSDWTNLTLEGYVNFWELLDGSRTFKVKTNVSGLGTSNPGSGTTLLTAQENGTPFNSPFYVGYGWNPGTASCPSSSYRYDWSNTSVDTSLWSNTHNLPMNTCPGWGYQSQYYVGNYVSGGDCGSCYSPQNHIFGNGNSGYYNHGNQYDYDFISYGMMYWGYINSGTATLEYKNQLWVR